MGNSRMRCAKRLQRGRQRGFNQMTQLQPQTLTTILIPIPIVIPIVILIVKVIATTLPRSNGFKEQQVKPIVGAIRGANVAAGIGWLDDWYLSVDADRIEVVERA